MQYLFWKINFAHKFILDFANTVRPLQKMNKKDDEFKGNREEKESFEKIKTAIYNDMVLCNLNFNNDFLLYTFTFNHDLIMVLMQKYI